LNRALLRAIILESAAKKSALEKILHPRIRRQWSAEAQTYRNSSDFFFADIPLLYETGGETLCDRVVVVACSPDVQLGRLRRRAMGFAPSRRLRRAGGQPISSHRLEADATVEAEKMMQSQMPLAEKMKRADHVVWNNAGRDALGEQARLLVQLWEQ
jgi:dephospho-CoA kinase